MSAKSTENAAASGAIPSDESCRCFSLSEILTTTNNFDDDSVIGIGGFGKVYKGSIDNGTITVAIKRLKDESEQGAKEFWMEVKMLSKLRHTHLVTLIGYCNEREEMILVYEYIANGTLENHLYKTSRKESGMCIPPLMWEQRLQICVDSARGLDYLHTGTHQRVIHRDVKTTNILLDEELVAKISDFGLSKSMTSQSMTHVSTKFKGTWGYLDPECFYIHKPTIKSDVYAFGVVLLEVLCGRPPVDVNLEEEQISLVLWAQHCIKKGKLDRIIDPFLIGQISPQCLKLFVEVANNCLHKSSKPRPTMAEVVGRLEFILALQRKGKTEGIVTKMFKGMNQWWSWEGKYNNSKSESENKVQMGGDELPAYIGGRNEQPKEDFNSAVEEAEKNKLVFFKGSLQNFDLEDLFLPSAEVMGKRNYGTTYKAVLEDGTTVIVKRLKDVVVGEREFVQQMEMVGRVGQHPNVVPLRAYYCFKDEKFMIYDYMVVGSLSALLHDSRDTGKVLDWDSRVKVCLGAARGLAHIHSASGGKFAHGNIKSSNVLLTLNLHGCISDFGLTTLMGFPAVSLGSAGYQAPEMIETTKTTQTSDVYSFGVVLLEMLTGKSPVHSTGHDDVVNLPRWVQSVVREEWTTDVFDIELMECKNNEEEMVRMLQIAMDCVKNIPYSRPKMDEVVKMIEEIRPDDSDNEPSSEDNKSRSPTTQTP